MPRVDRSKRPDCPPCGEAQGSSSCRVTRNRSAKRRNPHALLNTVAPNLPTRSACIVARRSARPLCNGWAPVIVEPTVLVLGAGASMPYGFPSGPKLADQVSKACVASGKPGERFVDTPFSLEIFSSFSVAEPIQPKLLQAFYPAFKMSRCASLDEFVQPAGNRQFLTLIKAAMSIHLVKREQDELLFPASTQEDDWLSYLFGLMRTDDSSTFCQNQVKVVTFNFDRSFERALFLMVKSYYCIADEEAAGLCATVPVVHLHGQLGGAKWLDKSTNNPRAYEPTATEGEKAGFLDSIRIVHEDVSKPDQDTVAEWMRAAHTVCFLGFGYHRCR
jgi:hypothetical protein